METEKYDYGDCHVCGTRMIEKQLAQDFWIKDKLVVVEGVPVGICPQCGEKVVNAPTGRKIMELIGNTQKIAEAPKITVPLLRFDVGIQESTA